MEKLLELYGVSKEDFVEISVKFSVFLLLLNQSKSLDLKRDLMESVMALQETPISYEIKAH